MNPEDFISIARQGLELTIMLSMPLLVAALVTGLLVSVFQAATQINEMTLSFIPKLLVMFAVAVLAGPWMLQLLADYTRRLFESIPGLVA
ncbi:MAG: flagellar biosynthesis protein FliQ [Rhodocyclaceae bacterium]|jgi:flagellar biosynthetic protein FliQ|nr:flagellar biosynthesis protein FliQ [Rhodocyclaceae bacterium]MCE2981734.1 flagellar biosynthesis protein FliQ [Betaproteobacteria bacterium]MCA3072998.1 flagellar biosynthesis protein FliQ [Rhodocyclaceae bacterium]MCA3088726.1 flagellar biosynthesis protein FliQ [Rhodocyclaceae bacterium]MCA3092490.1 flagellar biosynthesis protein FliQ [Rhodocyclaceae bacterium]